MNKPTKPFNLACAEYEGYKLYEYTLATENLSKLYLDGGSIEYNPHGNMNQLLPVVDKILKEANHPQTAKQHLAAMTLLRFEHRMILVGKTKLTLEQSLIDFVSEALNIEATNVES